MERKKISKTLKILFTIPTLQAGGAERVLTTLVNYWAQDDRFEISLLVHDRDNPFYAVHPAVKITKTPYWKGMRKWVVFFATYRHLKRQKPDVVVPFILWNNILTVIAAKLLKIPCLLSERVSPHIVKFPFTWIRNIAYSMAAGIVIQTKRGALMLPTRMKNKFFIIPNPVLVPPTKASLNSHSIISVGRLTQQKQFPHLISAFDRVEKKYKDWTLTIFGEGSDREKLEKLIREKNLTHKIFLPGRVKDLASEMVKRSIFVLSSEFEGMPNVLAEAMALGLSVVSTDCPTGPRELIEDGKDGLLVPVKDVSALAKAMEQLMKEEALREQLGKRAAQKMTQYSVQKIASLWEKAWERILESR